MCTLLIDTYRYAQRVASITNKAKKNQTSKADLERELRATIAALREQLLEEKKKAIQAAKSGNSAGVRMCLCCSRCAPTQQVDDTGLCTSISGVHASSAITSNTRIVNESYMFIVRY